MKGVTGENLLQLLERRLDNVVYRLGFACDHAEARQLVRHGHFRSTASKVDIPSFLVPGATTPSRCSERSRKIDPHAARALAAVERRGVPQWIELDKDAFEGKLISAAVAART